MPLTADELRRFKALPRQGRGRMPRTDDREDLLRRFREKFGDRRKQIDSIEDFVKAWEEEDVDIMELLSNIPGSAMEFGGDVVSALGDIITSPVETARTLGSLGVGVADLPFRAAGVEAEGLQKHGRETLGQLAGAMAGSVTPSGITKRPVEALANLAVGGGTALKGLGALSRVGRMPQVAQQLKKAGETAMKADPTTMPLRAAGPSLRAAKAVTGAALRPVVEKSGKAYQAARRKVSDDFGESLRGVSTTGQKIPLWKELLAAGLGFTTGTSPSTILMTMEKARIPGMGDIIRNARRDRAGAWEKIVKRGAKDTQKLKQSANSMFDEFKKKLSRVDKETDTSAYDAPVAHGAIADGIEKTLNKYRITLRRTLGTDKEAWGPLEDQLGGGQARQKLDPVKRVKYTVEFHENTTITTKGNNRKNIKDSVEKLLNDYSIVADDPGAFKLGHVRTMGQRMRDELKTMSATDEVSASTRAVFTAIQKQLGDAFKENVALNPRLGKEAASVFGKYENAMIALDEYADLLGISPDMVTDAGKLKDGLKNASISKMNQSLNEGKQHMLKRLQDLEELSGDKELLARMTGAAMQPLFGAGLVVKSEISQAMRAIVALSATIWTVPASLVFSPRAVNEILLRMPEGNAAVRAAYKRNATELVKNFRAMQSKLKPLGINLKSDIAKEGVTIGVLMERLQETAQAEEEQTRR